MLDLGTSNVVYESFTSTINLSDGIADLATSGVEKVLYGTDAAYAGAHAVSLTNVNGTYTFTNDGTQTAQPISALGATDSEVAIATTYATSINTAAQANQTVTVNGSAYLSANANGLTINAVEVPAATGDGESTFGSKLYYGTVAINSASETTKAVTSVTNEVVAAESGDGIQVFVNSGSVNTISVVNDGDKFSVTVSEESTDSDGAVTTSDVTTTYTMTAAGLITGETIWTNPAESAKSEYTVTELGTANNWTNMIAVASSTVTADKAAAVIVDSISAPTTRYGTVAYTEEGGYTVAFNDGVTAVSTIAIGSEAVTVNVTGLAAVNVTTTMPTAGEGEEAPASVAFTVNGKTYTATAALTIQATDSDSTTTSTLTAGTVIVTTETALTSTDNTDSGKTISTVTGNVDGVVVVVANGAASSIKDLDVGEEFTYDDKTYKMVSEGQLSVVTTDSDGTVTTDIYLDSESFDISAETDLLTLEQTTPSSYVPNVTDTIDLSEGGDATNVIYGTGAAYTSDTVIATLDKATDSDGNVTGYTLTPGPLESSATKIDASKLDAADITLDVDSDTKFTNALDVTMPAVAAGTEDAPTYTVNGTQFVPVGAEGDGIVVNIAAAGGDVTLKDGTVTIDADTATADIPDSVALTGGAAVKASSSANTMEVTAVGGALTTISGIDSIDSNTEVFTITGLAGENAANGTYYKTDAGLFYTSSTGETPADEGEGGTEGGVDSGAEADTTYDKVVKSGFAPNNDSEAGTLTIANIELADFLQIDADGDLDLTVEKATGTDAQAGIGVYSNDLSAQYATVTYATEGNVFAFAKEESYEAGISSVTVGAATTSLQGINFVTTINAGGTESTGTFTVNSDVYVAENSALVITAMAPAEGVADAVSSTALDSGAVKLTAGDSATSDVTLTDADATSVAVSKGAESTVDGTVIVTVTDGGVLASVAGIGNDETFTVTGNADKAGVYDKTSIGLFKTTGEEGSEVVTLLTGSADGETAADISYDFTGTWTAVEVLTDSDTAAIVISDAVPASDTTYVNADKTELVAEYNTSTKTLTAKVPATTNTGAVTNPITLNADGVTFDGNFSGSKIAYGEDLELTVVATKDNVSFQIDKTEGAVTVADATELKLFKGAVVATTDQLVGTAADTSYIKVTAEVEKFTVTLSESDVNVVNIGGITTDATVSLVTGTAGSMVERLGEDNGSKAITYTFTNAEGSDDTFTQTFTLSKDDSDGVDFIVDETGRVTEVKGLDNNAVMTITTTDANPAGITINTIADFRPTASGLTVIGTNADNESSASKLLEHEFYVNVTGAEEMSVYIVNDNKIADPLPESAADIVVGDFGTIEEVDGESFINLEMAVSPTTTYPITIHNGAGENIVVTLRKDLKDGNPQKVYISKLKGDDVYVKIDSLEDTLTLVQLNGDTIENFDASLLEGDTLLPLSGSFGIPTGMKLIVKEGFEITTDDVEDGYGNVVFGTETSTIHLEDLGMVVSGATAGVYVGLDATGISEVNGVKFSSVADVSTAAIVQSVADGDALSAKLYSGTVEINNNSETLEVNSNTFVALTGGETVSVADGGTIWVIAAEGTTTQIAGIRDDEAFTIESHDESRSCPG